jgi:hypothetical protein
MSGRVKSDRIRFSALDEGFRRMRYEPGLEPRRGARRECDTCTRYRCCARTGFGVLGLDALLARAPKGKEAIGKVRR